MATPHQWSTARIEAVACSLAVDQIYGDALGD
jgi:hypothetical protein